MIAVLHAHCNLTMSPLLPVVWELFCFIWSYRCLGLQSVLLMLKQKSAFLILSNFQLTPSAYPSVLCLVIQSYVTLCDSMDCSLPGSSVRMDSPGKNTRVGCHAILQGIFPTQGLNPGLPHCRWILYQLSYQGSWPIHLLPHNYVIGLKGS